MRPAELSRLPHDGTGVIWVPIILDAIENDVCNALLMLYALRSRLEVYSECDADKGTHINNELK
tara:strand:+ start:1666 stop:1857 length:192 start_codon:yes stop_codon:yes gene_type:complete